MTERSLYPWLIYGWIGLALLTFCLLFFVVAPYGRHSRAGWGPGIDRRLGWIVMESPTLWLVGLLAWLGQRTPDLVGSLLVGAFLLHYAHRVLVYPFTLRGGQRQTSVSVVAMAFCFNLVNGYIQGRHFFHFAPAYPVSWLFDPRFIFGALLFGSGLAINLRADGALARLRAQSEGYQIPTGGLYRWVSCPNYLGELMEWVGWAMACWSLATTSFAVWVGANLVPRARSHHRWYGRTFDDYPAERRAIIPYLF